MRGKTVPGPIKVVHLSSVHPADDIRIFWKECVSLVRAGYEVVFIVPEKSASTGTRSRENIKIIPVSRHSGRLGRMLLTVAAVTAVALRQNADVYHFHDPELIPCGLLLRALGKRVIYDAHEDLPRSLANREWIPRSLRSPIALTASAVGWIADRALSGVVAATPVIARRFRENRVTVVQNFAHRSEFLDTTNPAEPGRYTVAYVGAVVPSRSAVEMVDAMTKIDRYPGVRLLIAGDISPEPLAARLEASAGWQRVDYRGRQDRAGVRRILAEARVGLALYHPVQAHMDCLPTKIFEYMAAGLPVIAADFPGFRRIVEDNRCGLCVPPCDVAAIASAIEWIFDNPAEAQAMGCRGREAALNSFSWDSEEQALLRLYGRVTAGLGRAQTVQGRPTTAH